MIIERHPYHYSVAENFPGARRIVGFEGGAAYAAERDGKPYIIVDEGTMADFLGPEDQDLLNALVQVIEFESEEERASYIKKELNFAVDAGNLDKPEESKSSDTENW